MTEFRVEQIAPQWPSTWALTEWLYWGEEVDDILRKDADDTLFSAAYEAVDWQVYYERLRGTPFYDWATEGGGILDFGSPRYVESGCSFSRIGDISTVEGDWLRGHPEFNQELHDIHVETARQMVDFILRWPRGKRRRQRRHKRSST